MSFQSSDIRPPEFMHLREPAMAHDLSFLQKRQHEFVENDCPACQSVNSHLWGEKNGFQYRICEDCETIYMSPRASRGLMEEFYKQSHVYDFWNKYIFPASNEKRKEKLFIPRAKKTVNICRKHGISGKLLEIGAAYGTFCESVRELNYFDEIIALEPTPGLAQTCREKGFRTLEQTVETLELSESSVDVIANFEVIEHLYSPKEFLLASAKFLKQGGIFVCTCPNGMGLGTLVLRENGSGVDHEHVNYFNPQSISLLFNSCGFEVLEVSTPGELDVELLDSAYQSHPEWFKDQDFFRYFLETGTIEAKQEMQTFLKRNLLSSHMWIVGRKR